MKTPLDVIREALLKPVPCPNCSNIKACRCMPNAGARLDTRARIVHDDLAALGLLALPQQTSAPTLADVEEVARFLAHESRFPRWSGDDWQALMTSTADIELAFAKAKAATEGGDKDITDAIGRARRVLLDHCESRRAAVGEQ